ncbi:MAG: NAD(P)/FAD-dependent oxidoreductase [Candidatus Cloacimonetes bacterium]|nr:NAD(P)/FAD-dependent oxidoreductase [Candidatus Cloacimonadota bacterium]
MNIEEKTGILIIGAGPSGLLAAISASRFTSDITIAEKMYAPGRKLLLTGNRRCNITNLHPMDDFYKKIHPNSKFLKHAFNVFFAEDILNLLHDCGVETAEENDRKIYPKSGKAEDVLVALMGKLNERKIYVTCNLKIKSFSLKNNLIDCVECEDGTILKPEQIILCTGGKSYPGTGSTGDGYSLAEKVGHCIIPTYANLVPLETEGDNASRLQGLSLGKTGVSLWINNKKISEIKGELIFTHFGLSGPAIINLSRYAVKDIDKEQSVEIRLDLYPQYDEQRLDFKMQDDIGKHGKMKIDNLFKLWLPAKMADFFAEELKIDRELTAHQFSAEMRKRTRNLMKSLRFKIIGHRSFKEAIVTAGGISTKEIHSKTMQSRIVPNLFFAGEILDLDGDTGGYNLQIAYSTGWLAGESAASNLYRKQRSLA